MYFINQYQYMHGANNNDKNMSTFVHTHLAVLSDKLIGIHMCMHCEVHYAFFDFCVYIGLNACLILNTTKSTFFLLNLHNKSCVCASVLILLLLKS